jgi:hypothetical protein
MPAGQSEHQTLSEQLPHHPWPLRSIFVLPECAAQRWNGARGLVEVRGHRLSGSDEGLAAHGDVCGQFSESLERPETGGGLPEIPEGQVFLSADGIL